MNSTLQTLTNTIRLLWLLLSTLVKTKVNSCDNGSAKKHILLLTSDFLPIVNGGIYRPLSWLINAKANNCRVTLVTVKKGEDSAQSKELEALIPDGTAIHRVDTNKFPCIYKVTNAFCSFGHHIWGMFQYVSSEIDMHDITHIVATGPSFHTFITSMCLSKKYKLPYYLDYRDEWTENPFDFVQHRRLEVSIESLVLRSAQGVSFTTESQLSFAKTRFPILEQVNTKVITNGAEYSSTKNAAQCMPDQFTISFVGYLGEHCDASRFLSSLREVLAKDKTLRDSLVLRFIGNKSDAQLELLSAFEFSENIEIIDQVPLQEAIAYMQSSTANLLILNENFDRYIPGKIYDYLASHRPIVCIDSSSRSEVRELLTHLNAGIFLPSTDINQLHQALLKLSLNEYSMDQIGIDFWLKATSRKNQAKCFFEFLESTMLPNYVLPSAPKKAKW